MTIGTSALTNSVSSSDAHKPRMPKELQDLESALQSGDVASAKTAYTAFTSKMKQFADKDGDSASSSATSSSSSTSSTTDPFQAAIADLGKALDSGDVSAAKQAFAKLQQVAKPHHMRQAASTQSASTSSPSSTDPDGDGDTDSSSTLNLAA